jgi:hypothetical protein
MPPGFPPGVPPSFGFPHKPPHHEPIAVIGVQKRLLVQGVEPNLIVQPTQLIAAQQLAPRQWVVTLMQPVKLGGVQPWQSTFDGSAAYPPVAPLLFTAPQLPRNPVAAAVVIGALVVKLRWGAGGVAWNTEFDYPAAGGVFGVTADNINIDVALKSDVAPYVLLADVPVVGAFMVEGQASDPSPLRWFEGSAQVANGTSGFWAVKPYARKLHVTTIDATLTNIVWRDTVGNVLRRHRLPAAPVDIDIDVPGQATVVEVANGGAAVTAYALEWKMGLV